MTLSLDQREWKRLAVDVPVTVLTTTGSFQARCLDLSSHGVKIQSNREVDLGANLTLQVHATKPSITDFTARVEITRVEANDQGFELGGSILDLI